MANKPTPAYFSPTVPDFPDIGQYQPIYGRFDLTTYVQGASDYEIMSFLVQCYNATLKGYSDVTQLSKDTVTAYNQLQTWVNTWFAELDVQQEINNKLQSMYEAGTLASAIAQSNTITPAVAQYLNSTEGTKNLSNVTAHKIEAMAASGSLGSVINDTGSVQSTTTNWLQQNVTPVGSAVVVDKSLTIEGAAADSKATGNSIDSLKDDIAELDGLIIVSYNEQYLLDEKITPGKYWLENCRQSSLASMKLWPAIKLKSGTYFYGNLQDSNSYVDDVVSGTHTTLSSITKNADGSITIDYDFILRASATTEQNGWFSNVKITDTTIPQGKFNYVTSIDKLEEDLFGHSEIITGKYYQKYIHNFLPIEHVRIKVVSASVSTAIQFQGLTDATNISSGVLQFAIKSGEEYLWTPTKKFEALYWGVNGSSKIEISYTNGDFESVQKIFYCGSDLEYTKIKDAIDAATLYMDSIVYVAEGTYDIIDEFGSDYFENLTSADTSLGIRLKNRVHVIFSPNSKVVCHYKGNNEWAMKNFSPFHCFENGFTVENLNIECSRVRYCIHDERNGKPEYCQSIYKNCYMKIDNSNNQYFGSTGAACIGGGLGSNALADIDNCVFDTTADGYGAGVYYHQSNDLSNSNHRAKVSITNSYFKHGAVTIDFSRTDASEDTDVIVTGNSFPTISGNNEQGIRDSITGTHSNLFAWNNEVRSL